MKQVGVLSLWLFSVLLVHGDLRVQLESFVNQPRKYNDGWQITVTNYSPSFAFKDMSALNSAMKSTNVLNYIKTARVRQQLVFVDFEANNLYFNEQHAGAWETSILTNRSGLILGRKGNEWWVAQRHGFQILRGSEDGTWFDAAAGKTNTFLLSSYERAISFFKLGLQEIVRGTLKIEGDLSDEPVPWSAQTVGGAVIHGKALRERRGVTFEAPTSQRGEFIETVVLWNEVEHRPDEISVTKKVGASRVPLYSYSYRGAVSAQSIANGSIYNFLSHQTANDVIVNLSKGSGERFAIHNGRTVPVTASKETTPSSSGPGGKKIIVALFSLAVTGAFSLWLFGRSKTMQKR